MIAFLVALAMHHQLATIKRKVPVAHAVQAAVTPPKPDPVLSMLQCIAWAESRDEPGVVNPASGAAGLYQFLPSTWQEVSGLGGTASEYSAAVQTEVAYKLYEEQGWSPWLGDACVS